MNVLFWFWGRTAGGARYSLEVAKALSEIPEINLSLSLSKQSVYFEEFMALGLPNCHVDTYNSFGQMLWQARNLMSYRKELRRFIRNQKIDVVYAPMTHIWSAAVVSIFKELGVKYVLTMHDAIAHPGDMGWLKNWLLKRDIGASNACITLTQTVRQQVHQIYAYPLSRMTVIPHGAFRYGDFDVRSLPGGRQVRLLFYGRILKYKGLKLLLDSLKILVSTDGYPRFELQIWGDGDLRSYENNFKDLQANGVDVVIENRWIEECEIESIFRGVDICVLPYIEASQSGVAAIAFATALPIVATPQPGLIEQLEKGGGVVSASCDPRDFACELKRVVSDPMLYSQISESALRQAEHELSWTKISKDIAEFLRAVKP